MIFIHMANFASIKGQTYCSLELISYIHRMLFAGISHTAKIVLRQILHSHLLLEMPLRMKYCILPFRYHFLGDKFLLPDVELYTAIHQVQFRQQYQYLEIFQGSCKMEIDKECIITPHNLVLKIICKIFQLVRGQLIQEQLERVLYPEGI